MERRINSSEFLSLSLRKSNLSSAFISLTCFGGSVGDLRFRLPVPNEPYGVGIHNATSFGLACPQQATISSDSISSLLNYINSTNALSPAGFENLTVLLDSIPSTAVTTPFGEDCTSALQYF